MSNLSINLHSYLRNSLGRYSMIGRKRTDLAYNRDCDLCIEGFPRSANTYCVLLVEKFAPQKLNIAHHLHLSIQLKRAVKDGVPSVLLIREPMAAIASLLLREQRVTTWSAFYWYNSFHEDLRPFKDKLIIWPFEKVIETPLECIRDLHQKTGLVAFDENDTLDNEEIFKQIDQLDKDVKSGGNLANVNSRPNLTKSSAKKEILAEIQSDPKWAKMRQRALDHYQFFTS
jgi:hypothetical protein